MKIVFMGTPDFAVSALEALKKAGHEIVAVVTQPDRPKGRSGALQYPPVKECALKYDIPVLQPERIKRPEEELRSHPADVYIVAAFGQLLSQEILDIPKYGCLNIHASLLPKYRGASPIQHAIIDGERKTGVTVQRMALKLDCGDILYRKEVEIEDTDTFQTLHDKLAALGGESVVETLALLEEGKIVPEGQKEELASYVSVIDKGMGEIDFEKSAGVIDRLIRGLTPWPSAYTYYRGKQLKLWRAVPVGAKEAEERPGGLARPGEITAVTRDYIEAATGEGFLRIYELQWEGKKRMSAHDFLLGVKAAAGERFGRD